MLRLMRPPVLRSGPVRDDSGMTLMRSPQFLTVFDEPVPPVTAPGVVVSGADPAVQLVDGLFRGTDLLGRVTHADAMIGLKVALPAGTGSVRVVVTLAMDDASLEWWDERVPANVKPRNAAGARLVQVLSQGEFRATTLITRRRSDHGRETRSVVEFDLAAAEIADDALLVVELRSRPEQVPSWADRAVPPYGAVGVRVDAIELIPQTTEPVRRTGHLAGGHVPAGRSGEVAREVSGEVEVRSGLFVANPGRTEPVWSVRAVLRPPQRRARYRRRKSWRVRAKRKAKRIGKELLPAAAWPSARRGLESYRGMRRRLSGTPVHRAAAPVLTPRLPSVPAKPRRMAGSLAAAALADLVATRRITVAGFDTGTGAPVPVASAYAGGGRFHLRPIGVLPAPVLVGIWADPARLSLRERWCRRWLSWRLSHGPAPEPLPPRPAIYAPELDAEDPLTNHAVLSGLLGGRTGGRIRLPAGRFPVSGLVIGPGWTIEGDDTTLVQPTATSEPMLHVVGSDVTLRGLRLELPPSSPGPHDGAHWTAITVGRYLYAEEPGWLTGVRLEDLTVNRDGRCAANSVTVIGAVSDLRVRRLSVTGGGTGLMVHWGGVGTSVSAISGPTYHPHDLAVDGLIVRSAFEGFCLSSVHDVVVREVRCEGVEIGFRLLAGDNADRYHPLGPDSEINRRITVAGCEIGWSGDLYAIRVAGWGRSEVDGLISRRGFEDLQLVDCRIIPLPVDSGGLPTRSAARRPVVLEDAGDVDVSGISLANKSEEVSGLDSGNG
jgi:hypothetical protein